MNEIHIDKDSRTFSVNNVKYPCDKVTFCHGLNTALNVWQYNRFKTNKGDFFNIDSQRVTRLIRIITH